MREFLFEYRFDGDVYGMTVVADDIQQARRKCEAMYLAQYKGEVFAKIPAGPVSWLVRLWRYIQKSN